LPEDERRESWHLASTDGRVAGNGAGGVELLGSTSLTRPAALVLGRIPGRALDGAYAVLARHRGLLGRVVPDGPGPRRFP